FLQGRISTSSLRPFWAAPRQAVLLVSPVSAASALFPSSPALLPVAFALAVRKQPPALKQESQPISNENSSLLPSSVAEVGNPFRNLIVVRNELAVRFVMLERARGIPEIQVAQNPKVPVRVMKIGELCQRRLITCARLLKLSLAPLHQTEFVVGHGVW